MRLQFSAVWRTRRRFGEPAVFRQFPGLGRSPSRCWSPSHAGALKCDAEVKVWESAVRQVRECSTDPTWRHEELIDTLRAASSKPSRRMDRCLFPLPFTPATSSEIVGLWRMISYRRFAACGFFREVKAEKIGRPFLGSLVINVVPLAAFLSHPRIRKMALPAFPATVAHALAIGPNVVPLPVASQGPPN